jgi:hypothetical protein
LAALATIAIAAPAIAQDKPIGYGAKKHHYMSHRTMKKHHMYKHMRKKHHAYSPMTKKEM